MRRGAKACLRRAGRGHLRCSRSGDQGKRVEGGCRFLGLRVGLGREISTTEDHHPYNNRTIYGAAKVFNEGLLRSFTEMYGLNYVALRYFNVYGPRMDVHGVYTEVLIRWMERIAAGRPPIILGDGTQTLDFVHVRDIARANLLAAKSGVTDEVFNVASGTETSLKDLAQLLARIMGSSIEPQYEPARKVNAVTRRLADMRKAERLLGFKTEISLEKGLRELIGWWRRERASAGERRHEACIAPASCRQARAR